MLRIDRTFRGVIPNSTTGRELPRCSRFCCHAHNGKPTTKVVTSVVITEIKTVWNAESGGADGTAKY
jgi:hypothetical protein